MAFRKCLIVLLAVLTAAPVLAAEERHALVIGNSKYEGDAALRNPANDAEAIEATLKKLDFKVTKKTNVELADLEKAVIEFRRSLKKGSVALFFYAGHGLQVKGDNYLVPIKARIEEEFQVKEKCFKVDQVLAAMDESESALKVVILDCCRDNPFTRGWKRSLANKGIAAITDIPDGTVIAFATAPGKTAADGRGANSPYTTHLVASFNSRPKEGLELVEALKEASRAVKKETGQVPWLNQEASLDKYFLWRDVASVGKPPASVPVEPPAKTADKPKLIQSKYYPLAVGNKWEYTVESKDRYGTATSEVVDIDEQGAILKSVKDLIVDFERITIKDAGIFAHHQGEGTLTLIPDLIEKAVRKGGGELSSELLLKFSKPDVPDAGTSWKVNYKFGSSVESATAKIISAKDTVTVPAGTFDAVVVEQTFSNGHKRITWFVPETGIVKWQVKSAKDSIIDSDEVCELKRFVPKSK